jgi:methylglutaconyl-CoA hydratase
MTDLLSDTHEHVHLITMNRIEKHNAFDEHLLANLQTALLAAIANRDVRVIVLKANGRHFSAGADLAWMQRMAHFSTEENDADAQVLARVMHTLYHSPKPTIAMVQGAAIGGGAGLVAACDIAVAAMTARFCFSEVTLGLIPAVISPYVIKAIGERAATGLFMSAEPFDAQRAYELQLVQHVVPMDTLMEHALALAHNIARFPPNAVCASKALVRQVADHPIDDTLLHLTATLIANTRASTEAQQGLQAFLNKNTST